LGVYIRNLFAREGRYCAAELTIGTAVYIENARISVSGIVEALKKEPGRGTADYAEGTARIISVLSIHEGTHSRCLESDSQWVRFPSLPRKGHDVFIIVRFTDLGWSNGTALSDVKQDIIVFGEPQENVTSRISECDGPPIGKFTHYHRPWAVTKEVGASLENQQFSPFDIHLQKVDPGPVETGIKAVEGSLSDTDLMKRAWYLRDFETAVRSLAA
jgi:hypothetical protein